MKVNAEKCKFLEREVEYFQGMLLFIQMETNTKFKKVDAVIEFRKRNTA